MDLTDKIWKKVPDDTKLFIKDFFSGCPRQLSQTVTVVDFAAGQCLMSTYDSCTYVYILLRGRLQAIEERISENPYHFTEILPVEIVGDYELFTGAPSRCVTVTAAEPSTLLAIQAGQYLAWIRQDANALFIRTRLLMRQVTDQGLYERQRLFLDNETKFLSFLVMECRRMGEDGFPIRIGGTREEMAAIIGCSVRTLNRIVKRMETGEMLSLSHGKLMIERSHYDNLLVRFSDLRFDLQPKIQGPCSR